MSCLDEGWRFGPDEPESCTTRHPARIFPARRQSLAGHHPQPGNEVGTLHRVGHRHAHRLPRNKLLRVAQPCVERLLRPDQTGRTQRLRIGIAPCQSCLASEYIPVRPALSRCNRRRGKPRSGSCKAPCRGPRRPRRTQGLRPKSRSCPAWMTRCFASLTPPGESRIGTERDRTALASAVMHSRCVDEWQPRRHRVIPP